MREPGGAGRTTVPDGAEGVRPQGGSGLNGRADGRAEGLKEAS